MNLSDNTKTTRTSLEETLLHSRIILKFILFFGCIVNVLMLAAPLYSMQVFDRVLASGNTDTLLMLTIIMIFALVLLSIIRVLRSIITIYTGNWIENKMSDEILKVIAYPPSPDDQNGGAGLMRDLHLVRSYLASQQLLNIMDTPWAILFIAILFILHVYFGILSIIGSLILVLIGIFSDKATRSLNKSNTEYSFKSWTILDQTYKNTDTVSAMNMLDNIAQRWKAINKRVQTITTLSNKRQLIISEFSTFFRLLLQIAVTGIGAYLVIKGDITPGVIIASSSIIGRAVAPFQSTISSYNGFIKFMESYRRLNNSLKTQPIEYIAGNISAEEGSIELDNVNYKVFGKNTNSAELKEFSILSNISFRINKGEVLLVAGASGAGKTTLVKIIAGIIKPSQGTIKIGMINILNWNRKLLANFIGYLPQNVELFSATIKENITQMELHPDEEKCIAAAKLARVDDMISAMPLNYNTMVMRDGPFPSPGQRQRIALARTFYNVPKIVLLDEPNSNLDVAGEIALAQTIQNAKTNGNTVVIVSHRGNILGIVDKVLVLERGHIKVFATREEYIEILKNLHKDKPEQGIEA